MNESQTTPPDPADIREAEDRIRPTLAETPLLQADDLGDVLGQKLRLKAENLQRTGSFKPRGALNWLLTAEPGELEPGLVTVSAGNHAMALAWAARQRRVPVTVVMPEGSSPLKIDATRSLGARVIIHGSIHDAVDYAHYLRREDGLTLVHPYDNPRIMAGQGTVGLELLRQCRDMERIICPIGGGGLISGLGLAVKTERPDVELIGVEPSGAATMYNAWEQSDPEAALSSVRTVAKSLAPAVVAPITYTTSRRVVDRVVTVSEEAIGEATRLLMTRGHLYAEPGAAVTIAALVENRIPRSSERATVAVVTGGNMDISEISSLP